MALVTCDKLGSALTNWLKLASQSQKDALLDELLKRLTDCGGKPLKSNSAIATCQDLKTSTANWKLNNGLNLPADASDCNTPITACGITRILNSNVSNPMNDAVANVLTEHLEKDKAFRKLFLGLLVSDDKGNLLQEKDGKLYVLSLIHI